MENDPPSDGGCQDTLESSAILGLRPKVDSGALVSVAPALRDLAPAESAVKRVPDMVAAGPGQRTRQGSVMNRTIRLFYA